MVQITPFATAAVMVATASARNCKAGINYCGWNFLNIVGNYQAQVEAALRQKGWQVSGKNIHDMIFAYLGGPNGEITVLDWCAGNCAGGGENHNGFCN